MSSDPLPPQPEVEWQLLALLHLSGTLPIQRVYRELADRFRLNAEQRNLSIGEERPENAWHNLCRQASRRLVDDGLLVRGPKGYWSATPEGHRAATNRGAEYRSSAHSAEELGL